jgi:hypothetical protein
MRGFEWTKVVTLVALIAIVVWLAPEIKALKADIKAMRVYLQSLPEPYECRGPGMQETSLSCYYKIKITDTKYGEKGLYKGVIAEDVYKASVEQCKNAMKDLRAEFEHLRYECEKPDEQPYKDVVYAFYVDGNPKLKVNEVYEFESVSGSRHLLQMEQGK